VGAYNAPGLPGADSGVLTGGPMMHGNKTEPPAPHWVVNGKTWDSSESSIYANPPRDGLELWLIKVGGCEALSPQGANGQLTR
jgi:hypothetical protein